MNVKRTAVVTGAASGIGRETATLLDAAGVALILVDRNPEVVEFAKKLTAGGGGAQAIVADFSDPAAVTDAGDKILGMCDHVDILVNNAGIHPKVDGRLIQLEDTSLENWELVFRVNTTAPFLLCQKLIPSMKANRWGRIINISSRAGRTYSFRAGTQYSASKAALIGLTRKLAGDFAAFGITANCIAPGQIETPLAMSSTAAVLAETAKRIPIGRLGTVHEIASAVVYLASDGASFITGTVMDINGGETML